MKKLVFVLLVAMFTVISGSVMADAATAAEKPDRLLLQWTNQQQMNWVVRISAKGFRFLAVPLAAVDTGKDQGVSTVTVARDGGSLEIDSPMSWSTGSAVAEIEPGKTGSVVVDVQDTYVEDRHTTKEFSLADLRQGRTITITSKEWPIRNCTFRLRMAPAEVEQEAQLLRTLGDNRKQNIDALLAAADRTQDRARRTDLLLRAAAACTGGCNHGPLEPNGWDLAIATYQKVIDENKGTDVGLNAMWAQAMCYACWYPIDCDLGGRGKGDYGNAIKLYQKLYKVSSSPSDKAEALRRMAEVQCFCAKQCAEGLDNYRKIAEEFPGSLPPAGHWTYRTCAPNCGTEQLAWDIYRAMVYNANNDRDLQSLFNEQFRSVKGNRYVDELALLVQGTGAPKRSGQVEPKIITRKEMILVGITSDGSDIHGTWVKYEKKQEAIKHKIEGTTYEWHDWDAHKCMVAGEVAQVDEIPEGMSVMRLPAGQYAVFTHRLANGGYTGLNSVMEKWLKTGPYEQVGDDSIQVFDKRFKGGDQPDSEIDFWIPVKPRAQR